jgi:hypothetical protein
MPITIDRLVYRSEATRPTDSLQSLAELLGEAQHNNARDGLTGALAVHQGRFLQVVEGPSGMIDSLERRLARDPRHRAITVLGRQPIETRAFGDWTMASALITPALAPELAALMAEEKPSPAKVVGLLLEAIGE